MYSRIFLTCSIMLLTFMPVNAGQPSKTSDHCESLLAALNMTLAKGGDRNSRLDSISSLIEKAKLASCWGQSCFEQKLAATLVCRLGENDDLIWALVAPEFESPSAITIILDGCYSQRRKRVLIEVVIACLDKLHGAKRAFYVSFYDREYQQHYFDGVDAAPLAIARLNAVYPVPDSVEVLWEMLRTANTFSKREKLVLDYVAACLKTGQTISKDRFKWIVSEFQHDPNLLLWRLEGLDRLLASKESKSLYKQVTSETGRPGAGDLRAWVKWNYSTVSTY